MKIFFKLFGIFCFSILIVGVIIYLKRDLSNYFLDVLNGRRENLVYSSYIVEEWKDKYVSNNFIEDNKKILLLDNVLEFEEYCNYRIDWDKQVLNDPDLEFYNGDLEKDYSNLEKYSSYYSTIDNEMDSRVFEESNKLYIYAKDLNFINDEDYICYGHFHTWVFKEDLPKKTLSQAQFDNSVSFVGKEKQGFTDVYVYFNSETKESIKIYIEYKFGFISSCELVKGVI